MSQQINNRLDTKRIFYKEKWQILVWHSRVDGNAGLYGSIIHFGSPKQSLTVFRERNGKCEILGTKVTRYASLGIISEFYNQL